MLRCSVPGGPPIWLFRNYANVSQRAVEMEEELVLDPEYFRGLCRELPQLSHAEVLLKRGRDDNEMTRYRYDVFLYMGAAAEPVKVSTSLDWTSAVADLESLERLLEDGPAVVEVLGIPNARVHADQMCWQVLAKPREPRESFESRRGGRFGESNPKRCGNWASDSVTPCG